MMDNTPIKILESKDEKIARLESEAVAIKAQLKNNNQELQSKLEKLLNERNITAEILKNEVAELNSKFEKAGLKISEKGIISVLDYSNYQKRVDISFNMFNSELNIVLQTFERLEAENNADYNRYTKMVQSLLDESEKLKQLFDYLNEFILNPPSKEFMMLMNNTLAIRKIAQDYQEFEKIADITKIKEKIKEQEEAFNEVTIKFENISAERNNFFENELKKIENFKNKLNARLNETGDEYKNFTTNMLDRLNEQLKVFEINLAQYQEIRQKETKLLNQLMKGGFALTGLLFLLCMALGGVIGYATFLTK